MKLGVAKYMTTINNHLTFFFDILTLFDKYLGILELDKFKEREIKDIFRTELLKAVQTCHEISAQW